MWGPKICKGSRAVLHLDFAPRLNDPLLSFSLYSLGTQAGPFGWQRLHVSIVSRQPSAMRKKVSLLPPVVKGMASLCASDLREFGRC